MSDADKAAVKMITAEEEKRWINKSNIPTLTTVSDSNVYDANRRLSKLFVKLRIKVTK
jgi:hypothetical protein